MIYKLKTQKIITPRFKGYGKGLFDTVRVAAGFVSFDTDKAKIHLLNNGYMPDREGWIKEERNIKSVFTFGVA